MRTEKGKERAREKKGKKLTLEGRCTLVSPSVHLTGKTEEGGEWEPEPRR